MCGIVGFLSLGDQLKPQALETMLSSIEHRGPDAGGIKSLADGQVILGHRRLSIVDLHPRGNQPLSNETESIWLTYNGEIYNHVELRETLKNAGHDFKTNTDSEVIVHAYEQWGPSCVERFNGIFAFGLWDSNLQQMLIARDQVGVKPLFYSLRSGCFLFASQPKAILQYPSFPRQVEHEALLDYLAYGVVPYDRCIFQGIKKLRAAHRILVDRHGRISEERYWSPPQGLQQIDYQEARKETQRLVDAAVNSQMMSDVRVGTCLSGGIDSSIVNAIAARSSTDQIHSFTIGFPEQELDERRYASIAASAAGTRHHEEELDFTQFLDLLPNLIDAFDEPIFLSSAVSYFRLSKLANQHHVKVLLSGDGGDELFAGYTRYRKLYGSRRVKRKDRARAIYRRYRSLAIGEPTLNPFLDHFARFEGVFDRTQIRSLAGSRLQGAESFDHTWRYTRLDKPDLEPLPRAQRLDFHSFLVDEGLGRTDRAGMYFGVEIRVPLLNLPLVEFALSLPPEVQMAGGTPKSLLKSCADGLIPTELITNRKRGFSAPFPKWIKHLLPQLAPLVCDGYLTDSGLLKPRSVAALFRGRDTVAAWQILSLELWMRHWIVDESLSDVQRDWLQLTARAA